MRSHGRRQSVVHVAFLAIQLPHQRLEPMLSVAATIVQHSHSGVALRLHVIADQPPQPLLAYLRLRTRSNRYSWRTHSTTNAPLWVSQLHRRLCSRGCRGPVCSAFMHKPLLHLYLPPTLPRVIFLDSDVALLSDISRLWHLFDRFSPQQAIGLADEENSPASQEPVVALGGISSNGGVELLNLARMRRSGYTALLGRYADGDARLPLNPSGRGIGILGEQVLYSWMSVNGTPGHQLFGRLPCSWNRQVASWPSHVSSEDAGRPQRFCTSGCDLLHGAGAEGKGLIMALRLNLTGAGCRVAFERARGTSRHYAPGSPSEALLLRVRDGCCGALEHTNAAWV